MRAELKSSRSQSRGRTSTRDSCASWSRVTLRLLSEAYHGVIRTWGFLAKELTGILRQPRLIASLVLGPFLILFLFGAGFRGQQPEFRTTLVVPNDPAYSDRPEDYAPIFAGVFKLAEVTRD